MEGYFVIMFFLLWIVVNCVLAHNKNRSVIAWGFWGLLVGVFSTIVLACLKTKQPKQAIKEEQETDTRFER